MIGAAPSQCYIPPKLSIQSVPRPMITCRYPRHPPSHLLHYNRSVGEDKGLSLPQRSDASEQDRVDPSSRIAFPSPDQAIRENGLMVMPLKLEAEITEWNLLLRVYDV